MIGKVMDYKLYVVRIFVTDWERAISFYLEKLGMKAAFRDDEMGWAQLDTGDAQLGLERVAPGDEEGRGYVGRFVGVSLSVSEIDAVYKELSSRGVEFLGPPERQPWGGILAHLRDPDGNVLTLLGSPNPSS